MNETSEVEPQVPAPVFLLLDGASVTGPWAERAQPTLAVALTPADTIVFRRYPSGLTADDVVFLAALASERSAAAVASRLHIGRRTAFRRLARLRAACGVASTADLLKLVDGEEATRPKTELDEGGSG